MDFEDINYVIACIKNIVSDLEQYALELQIGDNKEEIEKCIMRHFTYISEIINAI